ncbi:hypothetical protein [Candidatus Nitrosocosmicus sp. T]
MLTSYSLQFSTVVASTSENDSTTLSVVNATNSTDTTNSSLLPSSVLSNASTVNLELPNSTLGLINTTSLSEQFANMDNLTNANETGGTILNDTQLTGTENITLVANFSSKPVGLDTDYQITGKPLVLINDVPLTYEYLNDTSDEITITDILISMRATVKLDNSTTSALPVYLKVFSNPVNTTQNVDGSQTIINSPNLVENIEIGGVIFSDASTNVKLYPNGTGSLRVNN